jgi:hypothetical protein
MGPLRGYGNFGRVPESITAGVSGCYQVHSRLISGKRGLKIPDNGDDSEIQLPILTVREITVLVILVKILKFKFVS